MILISENDACESILKIAKELEEENRIPLAVAYGIAQKAYHDALEANDAYIVSARDPSTPHSLPA